MTKVQKNSSLSLALGVTFLSLALASIRSQGQATLSENPFAESKVRINFQNLAQQPAFAQANVGIQSKITPYGVTAKATEVQLPEGLGLVALVDNECATRARSQKSIGGITASSLKAAPRIPTLNVQAYAFQLEQNLSLRDLSDLAESDPCVVGLVEDFKVYVGATNYNDDPKYSQQGHLPSIHAAEANQFFWGSSFAIKEDVVIAIIDTGIDYTHPDLSSRLWSNASGQHGTDLANNDSDPMDDHGHGTHCAGLAAAASSNQVGVSGVFGYHAKLMAVKVMGSDGSGSIATIVNGVNWAANNGAQVLNMSLGGSGSSAALQTALSNALAKGIFILAAAGNDGAALTTSNFQSPASYGVSFEGVLTVGSFDDMSGQRSSFSNYSTTYVEIGSPGSEGTTSGLLSTYPTALGGQYARMQGTSMATPVATGTAALVLGLLKSNGFSPTSAELEKIMTNGAIKSSGLSTVFKNGNKLDLQNLGRYLQAGYLFEGSAGFEEAQ